MILVLLERYFAVDSDFETQFQTDCVLRCGDTVLCLRSRHTPNNREIMVQRRCYAHVWRFRILRVNQKSIKWTWVEPSKINISIG